MSKMRSSKRSDGIEVFCSPFRLLWRGRPEGRCEAHNPQVVEGDIFATPNSLKSQVGRKLLSPFSNIRAIRVRVVHAFEVDSR